MDNNKPIIKYLTDYLEYLEIEKGLASKTQENYSRFLNIFFKWQVANNLQNLKPSEFNTNHIWKYRVYLSKFINLNTKNNLKKSTQNYYLISLRGLLEFFAEKNIPSLPPVKVKLAKEKGEREVKFLKLDQIKKLLESPDINSNIGLRDRAIIEILFSTGLRVSELTALNREQFKIKDSTKDLEIVIIGKGNKVRTVYLSSRAVN